MVKVTNKKKGQIVTAFLVKLILAILLLFAAASLVGQIFSVLLDQSGENFVDFVSDIKYVSEQDEGYKLSSLVILDENSAVVYFEGLEAVEWEWYFYGYLDPITTFFERPKSCSEFENCICLMQNVKLSQSDDKENVYMLNNPNIKCIEIETKLDLFECSMGVPTSREAVKYNCDKGFVMERNILDPELEEAYLHNERRRPLVLERTKQGLKLSNSDVYLYEGEPYKELEDADYAGGEGQDYLP